jgi:hypothetical protein
VTLYEFEACSYGRQALGDDVPVHERVGVPHGGGRGSCGPSGRAMRRVQRAVQQGRQGTPNRGDTSEESQRQREVSGCGVGGAEKMMGLDGIGKAGVPLAADVTVGLAIVTLRRLAEARGAPAYGHQKSFRVSTG